MLHDLVSAVLNNDVAAFRLALERVSDVNAVFETRTALGCAVENGSLLFVNGLIEAGAHPDKGGIVYPLHEALKKRRVQIAKTLLDAGADVNRPGEYGTTPLMMAVLGGSVQSVKLLLNSGANVSATNDGSETAYDVAVDHHKAKIAELLKPLVDPSVIEKQSSSLLDQLGVAAKQGDLAGIRKIVASGVDVNIVASKKADNALTMASRKEHLEAVKLLLKSGASPNIYGYWPAIAFAAFRGNIKLVQTLITAGANVNALSESGESALMRAAEEAHLNIVDLLLEFGADVNVVGVAGKTPLSQAYDYEWRNQKQNPVVDRLIERGASNLGNYSEAYSNWMRPKEIE